MYPRCVASGGPCGNTEPNAANCARPASYVAMYWLGRQPAMSALPRRRGCGVEELIDGGNRGPWGFSVFTQHHMMAHLPSNDKWRCWVWGWWRCRVVVVVMVRTKSRAARPTCELDPTPLHISFVAHWIGFMASLPTSLDHPTANAPDHDDKACAGTRSRPRS